MKTEQERIQTANGVIDDYCNSLKQKMADVISLYKRNNPGWEFSQLDFRLDEDTGTYTLTPIFQRPKQ